MLNTKITDKTPMVDILKKVEAEVFVGNDTTDPYEVAQALIKELYDLENTFTAAIKEVRTKLEILNDEFQSTHERNPKALLKNWTARALT